jgi:hypothetical protein
MKIDKTWQTIWTEKQTTEYRNRLENENQNDAATEEEFRNVFNQFVK